MKKKFRLLPGPAVLALAAALGFALPSPESPGAALAQRPPLIYVTNDIHYLAESLHDDGPLYLNVVNQRDGKFMEFIVPIVKTFEEAVRRGGPDIVLANGDLTFNGAKASHQELAAYFTRMEQSGAKVYVIPGNHDILNPNAVMFWDLFAFQEDPVTPQEFSEIYRDFGYAEALSRDRESLSYIVEPLPGLRLLMLDSCKYLNNEDLEYSESGGVVRDATLQWIEANLREARQEGIVLAAAMHHSSMDHHPMVNENFTIDNAEELRETLSRLGINLILTGHIHAQAISARDAPAFYDIATSALSVYPHQFGVLEYLPGETAWRYSLQALDVPAWAEAEGAEDPRLRDFPALAEAFFTKNAEAMVKRRVGAAPLGPDELAALTELVALANKRYFAGAAALNSGSVSEMPGYTLLQSGRFESLRRYVDTILEDPPPPNTGVVIPVPGTR